MENRQNPTIEDFIKLGTEKGYRLEDIGVAVGQYQIQNNTKVLPLSVDDRTKKGYKIDDRAIERVSNQADIYQKIAPMYEPTLRADDTPGVRRLERSLGVQFDKGPSYASIIADNREPIGTGHGIKMYSQEEIASWSETREARNRPEMKSWSRLYNEISEQMRVVSADNIYAYDHHDTRKPIFKTTLAYMLQGANTKELVYDENNIPYWQSKSIMEGSDPNTLRNIFGDQALSKYGRFVGMDAFADGLFNEIGEAFKAIGTAMEMTDISRKIITGTTEDHRKEGDYSAGYLFQNIGSIIKTKKSENAGNESWTSVENFWGGAGSAIGQVGTQILMAYAGGPVGASAGYVWGGMRAASMANEIMLDTNVPVELRPMIYMGVGATTSIVERFLGGMGLDPFVRQYTSRYGARVIVSESLQEANKASGNMLMNFAKASAKDQKVYTSKILGALQRNSNKFMKMMNDPGTRSKFSTNALRVFAETVGEGLEELGEGIGHEMIYTLYDRTQYQKIKDSRSAYGEALLRGENPDINDYRQFITDYDHADSLIKNWANNYFTADLLPEFVFGAIGGFGGSMVGLATQSHRNRQLRKKGDQTSSMLVLLNELNGDVKKAESILTDMFNKGELGATNTDGQKTLTAEDIEAGAKNLNQINYEILLDDLRTAKERADMLGLEKFSEYSGAFSRDENMLVEYYTLLGEHSSISKKIEDLQAKKTNVEGQQGDTSTIDKEVEALLAEKLEVESVLKTYTEKEEGTKFSQAANKRVKNTAIAKEKIQYDIDKMTSEEIGEMLFNNKITESKTKYKKKDIELYKSIAALQRSGQMNSYDMLKGIPNAVMNRVIGLGLEENNNSPLRNRLANALSTAREGKFKQLVDVLKKTKDDAGKHLEEFADFVFTENITAKDINDLFEGIFNLPMTADLSSISSLKNPTREQIIKAIEESSVNKKMVTPETWQDILGANNVINQFKNDQEIVGLWNQLSTENNLQEMVSVSESLAASNEIKALYKESLLESIEKNSPSGIIHSNLANDKNSELTEMLNQSENVTKINLKTDALPQGIDSDLNKKIKELLSNVKVGVTVNFYTDKKGAIVYELEYDTSKISEGEMLLVESLEMILKVGRDLYVDGNFSKINNKANPDSIIGQYANIEQAENILREYYLMKSALNKLKAGHKTNNTTTKEQVHSDGSKTSFTDFQSDDMTASGIDANRAVLSVTDSLNGLLKQIETDAKEVQGFQDMRKRISESRSAIMDLWSISEILQSKETTSINKALLEKAGITLPDISQLVQYIEDFVNNGNKILDDDVIHTINTLVEQFNDSLFEAYKNPKSNEQVKLLIVNVLENFSHQKVGSSITGLNAVEGNYAIQNTPFDILSKDKQGLDNFSGIGRVRQGNYNPGYHHIVNLLHRAINIKESELRSVLFETALSIEPGSGYISATAEQLRSEIDVIATYKNGKVDNFVLAYDRFKLAKAYGAVDGNNIIPYDKLEKGVTDYELYLSYYSPQRISQEEGYFDNGSIVLGNAGSGKTTLAGLRALAFAKLRKQKKVTVTVVSITNEGLTSLENSIINARNAHNKGKEAKNQIEIVVKKVLMSDMLTKETNKDIKGRMVNTDLVMIDEAGRLQVDNYEGSFETQVKLQKEGRNDFKVIKRYWNESNKTGNVPITFIADNQQARGTKPSISKEMPVQHVGINTIPVQHRHRSQNTEIDKLMNFWGQLSAMANSGVSLEYIRSLLTAQPTVFTKNIETKQTDGSITVQKHGVKYFENITDVIEEFNKANANAVIVFMNDDQADQFIQLVADSKRDKVYVIYNDVQIDTPKYKSIQGLETSEVYIASKESGKSGDPVSTSQHHLAGVFTMVSRGMNFVGMVGTPSLNKDDGSFKVYDHSNDELQRGIEENLERTKQTFVVNDQRLVQFDSKRIESDIPTEVSETVNKLTEEVTKETEALNEEVGTEEESLNVEEEVIEETDEQEPEINEVVKQINELDNQEETIEDPGEDFDDRVGLVISGKDTTGNVITGTIIAVTADNKGEVFHLDNGSKIKETNIIKKDKSNPTQRNYVANNRAYIRPAFVTSNLYDRLPIAMQNKYGIGIIQGLQSAIFKILHESDNLELSLVYEPNSEMIVNNNEQVEKRATKNGVYFKINLESVFAEFEGNEAAQQIITGLLESGITDITIGSLSVGGIIDQVNVKNKEEYNKTIKELTSRKGVAKIDQSEVITKMDNLRSFVTSLDTKSNFKFNELIEMMDNYGSEIDVNYSPNLRFIPLSFHFIKGINYKEARNISVQVDTGHSIDANTMRVGQMKIVDNTYTEILSNSINEAKQLIQAGLSEDGSYTALKNNEVIRLAYASKLNREMILPENIKFNKAQIKSNLEYLTEFVETFETLLSEENEVIDNLYVPLYADGTVSVDRLISDTSYIGTAMLLKLDGNSSKEAVAPSKSKGKRMLMQNPDVTETSDLELELTEELKAIIGEGTIENLFTFKNVDAFANNIYGMLDKGKVKIYVKNGQVVKGVIKHEFTHLAFEHGLTPEAQRSVLEDYVNTKIEEGNTRIEEMWENQDLVGIKEAMATESETMDWTTPKHPDTLMGKFIKGLNLLWNRVLKFFGAPSRANTYGKFIEHIKAGNYADAVSLNTENYSYSEMYMSDTSEETNEDAFETGEDVIGETISEIQKLKDIFSGDRSSILYSRILKMSVVDATGYSFNNSYMNTMDIYEASNIYRNRITNLVRQAINPETKKFDNNLFEQMFFFRNEQGHTKDLRTLEYDDMVSQIDLIETELGVADYTDVIGLKMLNGLVIKSENPDTAIKEVRKHIDSVMDIIFPRKKQMEKKNQHMVDKTKDNLITGFTPEFKIIATSIPVAKYEVNMSKDKFGNVQKQVTWDNMDLVGGATAVRQSTMVEASKQIGREGLRSSANNVRGQLEEIAKGFQLLGTKKLRDTSSFYVNMESHELLTLAGYFFYDEMSLWNKYQIANDSQKQAIEDFITAFKINYINIHEKQYSKIDGKALQTLNKTSRVAEKGAITDMIKKVSLNNKGMLSNSIMNNFLNQPTVKATANSNGTYVIEVTTNEGYQPLLVMDKNGQLKWATKIENGQEVEYSKTSLGVARINQILKSFGLKINKNGLESFINNPGMMIEEAVNSAYGNNFKTKGSSFEAQFSMAMIGGMMLSANVGASVQRIFDIVGSIKNITNADINKYYEVSEWIYKNKGIDVLNESIEKAQADIRRQGQILNATDKQVEEVINLLNRLKVSAVAYRTIIDFFHGKSNIDPVNKIADNTEFEQDTDTALENETEETVNNLYVPNPLDFQIGFPELQNININNVSKPGTIHVQGKAIQINQKSTGVSTINDAIVLNKIRSYYNNELNPFVRQRLSSGLKLLEVVEVAEFQKGNRHSTDLEFGEFFNSFFEISIRGIYSNKFAIPQASKGDSNKLDFFHLDSNNAIFDELKTLIKSKEAGSVDIDTTDLHYAKKGIPDEVMLRERSKRDRAYAEVYSYMRDFFFTQHKQHVESVQDFIGLLDNISEQMMMNQSDPKVYSQLLKHALTLKGITDTALEPTKSLTEGNKPENLIKSIRGYKYYQVLESIHDALKVINSIATDPNSSIQIDNKYLQSLGLREKYHYKIKDGKIVMGNALSFRTEVTEENNKLSKKRLDTYSGAFLYQEQWIEEKKSVKDNMQKKFLDYNPIPAMELTAQKLKSQLKGELHTVVPQTASELVFEMLTEMYQFDTMGLSRMINNIKTNHKMTPKMTDLVGFTSYDNGPLFKYNGTPNHAFALLMGAFSGINENYLEIAAGEGSSFAYDDIFSRLTRLKTMNTPVLKASESKRGFGRTFKVAVMQDIVSDEVAVKVYNATTKQLDNSTERSVLTDGGSIMPAISARFQSFSFAGKFNPNTSQTQKSIITQAGTNPMLLKHAATQINGEMIKYEPSLINMEYLALKSISLEVANEFVEDMNRLIKSNIQEGDNDPIANAFDRAIDLAWDKLMVMNDNGSIQKESIIGMFTVPSAAKLYKGKVNIQSYTELATDPNFELDTIDVKTESLGLIFNADTDIENAEGEKMMKQLMSLVKGSMASFNPDLAEAINEVHAELILSGIRTVSLADGTVSTANANKIIDKAVSTAIAGLGGQGVPTVTGRILAEAKNNKNLLNNSMIHYSLNNQLRKGLNKLTSNLSFNGTSYNQVMSFAKVYDIEIQREGLSPLRESVSEDGLRRRQQQYQVTILQQRDLNFSESINGEYKKGEVIAGTVNMHKFNITKGMSLTDVSLVEIEHSKGRSLVHINEISDNGQINIDGLSLSLKAESVTVNGKLLEINKVKSNEDVLKLINDFKQSLEIILTRKPTTLTNASGLYSVIDFAFDTNSIYYNAKKNAWDDSDNDIDKLYSWEYDLGTKDNTSLKNELLILTKESFNELAKNDLLNVSVGTEILDAYITNKNKSSAVTITSSLQSVLQNKVGLDSVAITANIQAATTYLMGLTHNRNKFNTVFNSNYRGPFIKTHSIIQGLKTNPLQYKDLVINAILLQAAVDTGKQDKLGALGLSVDSLSIFTGMLWSGSNFEQALNFMKSRLVADVFDTISSAKSITGKGSTRSVYMEALNRLKSLGIKTDRITSMLNDEQLKSELRTSFTEYNKTGEERGSLNIKKQKLEAQKRTTDEATKLANIEASLIDITNRQQEISNLRADAEIYTNLALLEYSSVGEVINNIVFAIKLLDGSPSKDHQSNSLSYMIESSFGMPIDDVRVENMDSMIDKFTDEVVQRKIDYQLETNNYIKQSTLEEIEYYKYYLKEQYSMYNIGNFIAQDKLLSAYTLQHKAEISLVSNSLLGSKEVKNSMDQVAMALGYGLNFNSFTYYQFKDVYLKKLMSVGLNKYFEDNTKYKSLDLSAPEIHGQSLVSDSLSKTYSNIDLTTLTGRHLFTKRFPTYALSFDLVLNKLYQATINGQQDVDAERALEAFYGLKTADLKDVFRTMTKYSGQNLFSFLTREGAREHDGILAVKNSKQLSEDPMLYGQLTDMFNALPKSIRDLLAIYEVISNGPVVRASTLYDIVGVEMLSELSNYYTQDIIDDIVSNPNVLVDDIAVIEGLALAPKEKTLTEKSIGKYLEQIENSGMYDANEKSKYTYIKLYTKDYVNGKKHIIKKVTANDLQKALQNNKEKAEPLSWDTIGVAYFKQGALNALPFFANKSATGIMMPYLGLTESQIHTLGTTKKLSVFFPNGHRFAQDQKRNKGMALVYTTNAGTNVKVTNITDKYVQFEDTNEGAVWQTNIPVNTRENSTVIGLSAENAIAKTEQDSNTLKSVWNRKEGESDYQNTDGTLVNLSVSAYANNYKEINLTDNILVRRSSGIVLDRIAKEMFNMITKSDVNTEQVKTMFKEVYTEEFSNLSPELSPLAKFTPEQQEQIIDNYIRLLKDTVGRVVRDKSIIGISKNVGISSIHDVRVQLDLKDVQLQGEIDTLVMYKMDKDVMAVIIDWKVTKTDYKNWFENYNKQVSLYAQALIQKGIKNVRTAIVSLVGIDEYVNILSFKNGEIVYRDESSYVRTKVQTKQDVNEFIRTQKEFISNLAEEITGVKLEGDINFAEYVKNNLKKICK
jgi:hypothetical protein